MSAFKHITLQALATRRLLPGCHRGHTNVPARQLERTRAWNRVSHDMKSASSLKVRISLRDRRVYLFEQDDVEIIEDFAVSKRPVLDCTADRTVVHTDGNCPPLKMSMEWSNIVTAPNLKGRPRKKQKKRSLSPGGSESNESESSLSTVSSSLKSKQQSPGRNGLRCNTIVQQSNFPQNKKNDTQSSPEEKEFLMKLHSFMKSRRTPISRVPHLGFKEIDLYAFFTKVQKLGGYNQVTANRQWKPIYDELGGHQGSTSAATYTRRHYERLLLPYERSLRGEQGKDAGLRNHVKLKTPKMEETGTDDKDNDVDSNGDDQSDVKILEDEITKEKSSTSESKTSALRSVRMKVEKLEENLPSDKENIPMTNNSSKLSNGVADISSCSGSSNLANGVSNLSTSVTISVSESKQDVETRSSKDKKEKRDVPEIIDLASEESPVKIGKTPVPALKKRKLEILKEGGLEVTAISSLGTETSVTPVVEKRPSVIQHTAPVPLQPSDHQVSITVTPDVSHIIGSSPGEMASTPSPVPSYESPVSHSNVINIQDLKNKIYNQSARSSSSSDGWSPPKVVQSRSIYTHSESVVYGNPKDIIDPQKILFPERAKISQTITHPGGEVLDLRVRSPQKISVTVSRVPSSVSCGEPPKNLSKPVPKTNSSFPIIGGRTIVGSNLEITVVDVPKSSSSSLMKTNHQSSSKQNILPTRKPANKLPQHRLPPRNENGKSISVINNQTPSSSSHRSTNSSSGGASLIIPNPYLSSSSNRNNSRPRTSQSQTAVSSPSNNVIPQFLPGGSSLFPSFLPPVSGATNGAKSNSPFLPIVDPLYYPSLYGSHGLYPPTLTPSFVPPLAAPPIFAPTAEQLQLYKELMGQHHTSLRMAQQGNAGFLGLPRDGSTSITPVGPAPHSSSK